MGFSSVNPKRGDFYEEHGDRLQGNKSEGRMLSSELGDWTFAKSLR